MNGAQFLELAASLSLQTAAVLIAASWLSRRARGGLQSSLWTAAYGVILALVVAGLLLPHPRWSFGGPPPVGADLVAAVDRGSHWGRLLGMAWGLGAVAAAALLVVRMVRASQFLRTCRAAPASIQRIAAEIAREDRGSTRGYGARPLRLLTCRVGASPFCWQFHRPFIVLPELLLTLDPERLRYVLRHELQHLRDGHPLQLFLQRVVEVLFWFHPVVWWTSRRAGLAREWTCDDAAVRTRADVVEYMRTLLYIVEQTANEAALPGAPLWFVRDRGILIERAQRLVRRAQSPILPASRWRRSIIHTAFVTTCLATPSAWLPLDALAAPGSTWSPWPTWSAGVLHDLGWPARDFEHYDGRRELHDLRRTLALPSNPS